MAVKKYYAVAIGKNPGIYTQWFGKTGAQAQVKGINGARYKGFTTIEEAREFISAHSGAQKPFPAKGKSEKPQVRSAAIRPADPPEDLAHRTVIYTDGSSLGNHGPGGYGVVIPGSEGDLELSAGYRLTTNNRMELLACIVGLDQLREPSAVALYSDSRYVVDGITKGWAKKWRARNWRKSNGEAALNVDLWARLLDLCERHDVRFVWVKGHAGNPGNERCDQLATRAASGTDLLTDTAYESTGA